MSYYDKESGYEDNASCFIPIAIFIGFLVSLIILY